MKSCIQSSWMLGLLAGVSAIGLASAAGAQDTPAGGAQAGSDLRYGDIIVTAQRREEAIQDVPIAITAFSNERLQQQNITSGQSLNGVVPSLTVGPGAQATREVQGFTLRGIGPKFESPSSVATYLAEVPLPEGTVTSTQGGPGNFLDLENVQVLAGPQGTLFGRNTTGGAVLLVPHKPTNELEGYVQASYGNYDYFGLEGVVNIPVVNDKLMIRAAASSQDRDGFTRDIVWNKDRDDLHYYTGRLSILFKPTENITNYLVSYYTKSDNNGVGYVHRGFNIPLLQASGACTDVGAPGIAPCDVYRRQTQLQDALGKRKVRYNLDQFNKIETWGVINKTSFELSEAFTVNNIVSYQRFKNTFEVDEDGTPLQVGEIGTLRQPNFPIPGLVEFGIAPNGFSNARSDYGPRDNRRQITEELQLQGNLLDDHLTFTAGGFYYDAKPVSAQRNRAVFGCPAADTGTCEPFIQNYATKNKSKALYAQATLDLGAVTPALEDLRLTGGYRYTWDRVSGFSQWYAPVGTAAFCILGFTFELDPAACKKSSDQKFKSPTWTIGADYKPISNLLLYVKASRGYRAGGFSAFATTAGAQNFGPEKVTTYEAGFKSDWNLGPVPLRLNLAAYKSDYSDIQTPGGTGIGTNTQTQGAKLKGFEADASIRPFQALEIGGNLSYTDGKFEGRVQPFETTDCRGTIPAGQVSNDGCPFAVAKWIYNIHGSLDLPVPESWGTLNLFANYSHVGTQRVSVTMPGGIFAPYGVLNLSAKWRNVGGSNFDIEAFGTNVTNKTYQITNSAVFPSIGLWSDVYGEPRMYGLRLRYSFGRD